MNTQEPEQQLKIHQIGKGSAVVLVGRPNVGKSTLFNRLTRSRNALVTAVPGTTRDRREGLVKQEDFEFSLVDTGGMGFDRGMDFSKEVEAQIDVALREAGLIWILLDAKEGLNPYDAEIYRRVLRSGFPFLLVINKADNPARQTDLSEFYRLGSDAVFPISSLHGSGIGELLEASAKIVPHIRKDRTGNEEGTPSSDPVRVAFLGRPNVGKSSLINRILGKGRMIVSPIPGTTREAVDTPFQAYGREYILVDTAGIRRKARTTEHLEKIGVLQSLGALNRVHVAVLVVDAGEEIATQDARVASYILTHNRSVVLALNKWDRIGSSQRRQRVFEGEVDRKLRFLDFAAQVQTSALNGMGLQKLFKEIDKASAQFQRRIQTADLNRMIQAAVLRLPPPSKGRSHTKINYGLQVASAPPCFRFFTSHPERITDSYTRFFEHQLRYHFGLGGTPLRIQWQAKDSKKRARSRRN